MLDPLVNAIFAAINRRQGTPEERRMALVRAGIIAQAYQGDSLVDSVFASAGDDALHDNDDLNLRSGSGSNAGTD
jgi:hypothetical protein